MLYLFAAYFILWAILFGYLWQLGARQKRLQRELDLVRQVDAARGRAGETPAVRGEGR